ncbi:hypothetical protein VaNZ11_013991 [Volvox africanus]|uniref:Uncharacterized protein n=1 Tax=Volvox africanus TaxID=51714 RepID=A0ABQ5SI02_9CHLO|nr:hypothetical protein VaNZ11_013991 [Volvox africanus]
MLLVRMPSFSLTSRNFVRLLTSCGMAKMLCHFSRASGAGSKHIQVGMELHDMVCGMCGAIVSTRSSLCCKMAYWGFKTPANFGMWLVITILLVTGAIWLIIGGLDTGGCNYCYSKFNKDLSPKHNGDSIDKGCHVLLFSFQLYEPKLALESDARGNMWGWCMLATGPVGELAAGSAMFLLGLLLLTYFCCAPRPSNVTPV